MAAADINTDRFHPEDSNAQFLLRSGLTTGQMVKDRAGRQTGFHTTLEDNHGCAGPAIRDHPASHPSTCERSLRTGSVTAAFC